MDMQQIAKQARASISKYCIEECKAYCCRKGYLVMSKKEADLVTNKQTDFFLEKGLIKQLQDGRYSFDLHNVGCYCPSLIDYKCTIHRKKNRPLACKEFPLFIDGNLIKLSVRCPAVREGLLYPYIVKLLKNGMKLAKTNAYADLDISKFNF